MSVHRSLRHRYHQFIVWIKRVLYGSRGEPYSVRGVKLRFLPGTRPIRQRYVHSKDPVNRYDAMQIELLTSQLNEGDVAIDIGAHHGVYSLIMAARCGQSGRVIAFEPDPYACEVLERNLALNPTIRRPIVEHFACSDSAGMATLYSLGGNPQSSMARSAVEFSTEHKSEELSVSRITLDSYLRDRAIPTPSWVKIDTEGAEIRILKRAEDLLRSDARIICELHPYAWPEFGNDLSELRDIVAKADRSMRYLDEQAELGERVEYGTVLLEKRR